MYKKSLSSLNLTNTVAGKSKKGPHRDFDVAVRHRGTAHVLGALSGKTARPFLTEGQP
jgi:hypothetical protein